MWIGIAAAALLLVGWQSLAPGPDQPAEPHALLNVISTGGQSRVERVTRRECLQREGRVWAVIEGGVECMAYVTAGMPSGSSADPGTTVVYISGDIPDNRLAAASSPEAAVRNKRMAETISRRFGVPVVVVGRPGLMGSTGFHMSGGMRDEAMVMGATFDAVKDKLSIRRLALAGQSGGARIIAQLLASGRNDIACAAMASGAYDVPRLVGGRRSRTNIFGDPGKRFLVPMLHIDKIVADRRRRNFVIGDPQDRITPFPEQRAWADKLAEAGHHVQLIESRATDKDHHGLSLDAFTAAAMCAKGSNDAEIRSAIESRSRK